VPLSGGDAARCETAAAAAAARPGARAPALNAQCFSAFYFRWLEAAGARALILPYDAEPALLAQLLDGVNGALLTGGELDAAGLAFGAPYMLAAKQVLDTARRKVDAGVFFPVHGTCQGMQVISLLASGNASIMSYNFQREFGARRRRGHAHGRERDAQFAPRRRDSGRLHRRREPLARLRALQHQRGPQGELLLLDARGL
jgi:gamma-glutamyl-gamma-aminobutyrate hydrolase PuuD